FHRDIAHRLASGVQACCVDHGLSISAIEDFLVPGAWELPLAAQWIAQTGKFSALVVVGAVIRGETAHFDYVAGQCAEGCRQVMLKYDLPIGFGVLTTENREQALSRSGSGRDNKGWEATRAALEMVALNQRLRSSEQTLI